MASERPGDRVSLRRSARQLGATHYPTRADLSPRQADEARSVVGRNRLLKARFWLDQRDAPAKNRTWARGLGNRRAARKSSVEAARSRTRYERVFRGVCRPHCNAKTEMTNVSPGVAGRR